MGWFEKKEERRVPELPELPALPELPDFDYPSEKKSRFEFREINQLPILPNSSFGNKFSQNAIKEAVSGEEEDEEVFDADEFEDEERTMQKPLENKSAVMRKKSLTREIGENEVPREFEEAATKVRRAEPIFIRIDKFEEAINSFEKTSSKIIEIEKMLRDIRKTKEEEEKELEAWENEIQLIKQEIEKIDRNVFSKVE